MSEYSGNKDILKQNPLAFHVSKLIDMKLIKGKCGRKQDEKRIKTIIKQYSSFTDDYGCYVYSVKAGKGYTPVYVGSAVEQTLGEEAFSADKGLKYLEQMVDYAKGTLMVSFVVPEKRRGRTPKRAIQQLEKYLTVVAYRKNRNLINVKNLGRVGWYIAGAVHAKPGAPRNEVKEFKKMMGLTHKAILIVENSMRKNGNGE